MNVCLVGSLRDIERIKEIGTILEKQGHTVQLPLDQSEGRFTDRTQAKHEFMKGMFEQMKRCDSLIAINERSRGGLEGYIGANTFIQLGVGMSLGKQLFALKPWDKQLPYAEELDAMGIQTLDIRTQV